MFAPHLGHPVLWIAPAVVVILYGALAAAIVFGTAAAPAPLSYVDNPMRHIDFGDLPPAERYTARDGTALAYRAYPGDPAKVAVLVHGSSGLSSGMHAVARALNATGATVYALDIRGHGQSGRRGDIDHIGQLDDDMADFVATLRPRHPGATITLVGHSSGGGFALRIAGGRYGDLFDRYLLLAPYLRHDAPTVRPGVGGWAAAYTPRLIALSILHRLGIPWFEGLPVIAFAVPPEAKFLTATYSFRLQQNFEPHPDYLNDFRRARKPMIVLAGGADELFFADRFVPLLAPVRSDLAIEVLPGLRHMDMVTHPEALAAITRVFAMPPAS